MSLTLTAIDFSGGRVLIMAVCLSRRDTDRGVRDFLEACNAVGFRKVTLQTAEGESAQVSAFTDLARSLRIKLSVADAAAPVWPVDPDGPVFAPIPRGDDQTGEAGPAYSLKVPAYDKHLPAVSQFIVLCSKAALCDERAASRLRLTLHELAANSMEHAKYRAPKPTVTIRVEYNENTVRVVYRDNAEPFSPEQQAIVNIAEKMKKGESRGFGLTLIRSMVSNMKYERQKGWNHLSYDVERCSPEMAGSGEK